MNRGKSNYSRQRTDGKRDESSKVRPQNFLFSDFEVVAVDYDVYEYGVPLMKGTLSFNKYNSIQVSSKPRR